MRKPSNIFRYFSNIGLNLSLNTGQEEMSFRSSLLKFSTVHPDIVAPKSVHRVYNISLAPKRWCVPDLYCTTHLKCKDFYS
ncbi:hypothetical protein FKM82_008806 [Ascaphus truei]